MRRFAPCWEKMCSYSFINYYQRVQEIRSNFWKEWFLRCGIQIFWFWILSAQFRWKRSNNSLIRCQSSKKNRCAPVLNLYLDINSILKQKYFVDVLKTGCKGAKWVYFCSSPFPVGHLKFLKILSEAICCDSVCFFVTFHEPGVAPIGAALCFLIFRKPGVSEWEKCNCI